MRDIISIVSSVLKVGGMFVPAGEWVLHLSNVLQGLSRISEAGADFPSWTFLVAHLIFKLKHSLTVTRESRCVFQVE